MSLIIRNGISPRLAEMARNIADKRPVLEAMALAMRSWTVRSFSTPGMRPSAWPAKADGSASSLEGTPRPVLRPSLQRKPEITQSVAYVGTDRGYAAVHQFGSRRPDGPGGGIPARPFFPFAPGGTMLPKAEADLEHVAELKMKKLLGL